MSYLAETIKKLIAQQQQATEKVEQAQKYLADAELELEEVDQEIQKAVQAAQALGELDEVSQELYDAYPDVDPQPFGLPLAKDRHMEEEMEEVEDNDDETQE